MAYKPDSVPRGCPRMDDHSSGAPVTKRPLAANPDRLGFKHPRGCPREVPIWHCSRWGLPCRFCCQSRGGLLPHRFTMTLASQGCLFSVALSLGLPPPGVTRHRCFVESGLSSTLPPRSSSHPREIAPKPKWRLRQRGSDLRDPQSRRGRCHQEALSLVA